ncbi:MAG: Spy/CpxP family protein refolding chaperone [Planctomycetes bacterium]|nr:Spy/CpxP family protein refolding chaperone [Planctomycetota bacterium]
MKKRILITGVVGAGILGLLVVPLLAGETGGEGASWKERLAATPLGRLITGNFGRAIALKDKLNLTDEQQQKIREIVQTNKAELAQVVQPVVEKKRALRQAVLAENADEKAIRAAADELGKAAGDAAVAISKVAKQVRAVLTPEQIEMIKQCRTENDQSVDQFLQESAAPK